MVILLVILTVVVFVIVDLALRAALKSIETKRVQKAREAALDIGLKLDYTDEAVSLRRVEVEYPKARILAVDDEEVVLDSFRKILVMAGYSIDTVERGKEALGLVQKRDYDFVFVDLRMPELDGVDVTKAVKHLRPDIDVIVITGYASVESAVETMKYGAMDYFQKPFTEDELTAFIDKTLIRRQDRLERQTKPQVQLVTPSRRAGSSRHTINVPAGVFVSPAHCWISLELSGLVRVGLDDFALELLGPIEGVEVPTAGQRIRKGATLFSVMKGDRRLSFPSPVSGMVASANTGLPERLGFLQMRPFDLGWMCTIEPDNLPGDLQSLILGANALAVYRNDIDRHADQVSRLTSATPPRATAEDERKQADAAAWQAFEQTFLHTGPEVSP